MVEETTSSVINFNTAFKVKQPIEIENIKDIEIIFVPYYLANMLERRGISLDQIQLNGNKVESILATQDVKDLISANIIGSAIFNTPFYHSDTTVAGIQSYKLFNLSEIFKSSPIIGQDLREFISALSKNNFEFNMSNIDLLSSTYDFKICNDVVYVLLKENFFNGMRFGLNKFRMNIIEGVLNYLFSQLPNDRVFKSRIFKEAIQFFN